MDIKNQMFDLMSELYPICRSITGNGVRKTLDIIKSHIDIQIKEIPSGTQVFDWSIPKEWNINDAYVIDPNGEKIIDFKKSNLHVVSYSIPINKKISFEELKAHLHTNPDQPNVIPYVTSYYKEDWGFCISHNQLNDLKNGEYQVCIDSSLENGYLTYGECFIPGQQSDEVIVSCYVCHPSLCNDNLSGVVLTTFLAKLLAEQKPRYSYRFLFIPETIGAIAWLSINEKNLIKIKHGLVATCLGDSGKFTYKKSRQGNAEIDQIVSHVLKHSESDYDVLDFYPIGSDERQFCSPAFNLSVGSLMRTPYHRFPEYHTSGDNLEFVKKENLDESLNKYRDIIFIIENNKNYVSLNPKCEPQLGKRGLYTFSGIKRTEKKQDADLQQEALLWVLNLSDGMNSLLDIANRSNLDFKLIKNAADRLRTCNLIQEK